ncbi:TPA: hypothetical protein ACS7Z7_003397 [Providencia alcalifaciens]
MTNNKAVTIVHLSDMKPNPVEHLNSGNNYNCCDCGKAGEGNTVDVIKLMEVIGVENKKI